MTEETFTFQTEVERLLDLVAHALYSHKEIFLRELISNASDACDRLRYASITDPGLIAGEGEFRIRIVVDRDAKTLSIIDNGIGMNRQDLLDGLGTIARSGTQAFLRQLSGDAAKDLTLIGQFGVGFYSTFMVADRVEVITRKAGEAEAWHWSSDGRGTFTLDEGERETRGTTVRLHLKEDAAKYLEDFEIQSVVKKYADHIAFPIVLGNSDETPPLNVAASLWTRPKAEITPEQYTEFYHHVGHAFDDPWLTLHNQVEGILSYTNLLFIPSTPPFDLFEPERKSKIKLYVKRVFITDEAEGIIPPYLRFLRGVVDSEDLPLNVSRETFQDDPRIAKMRAGIVKRVLDELTKKTTEDADGYRAFWEAFGALLKEGLYEDYENRDKLLSLVRLRSTADDGWTSLDAYVERMKPGQTAIYTLSGDEIESLRRSPQLEGFAAKGVEVLLLTDPVDEFWIPAVARYKDKPFQSAAKADTDLSAIEAPADDTETGEDSTPAEGMDRLVTQLKDVLKDTVKDVRVSTRLRKSAVCLVAAENEMDMHLERLLRRHRSGEAMPAAPKILEVNPGHPLIRRMAALAETGNGAETSIADAAYLLLDQARIVEGESVADPVAFAERLASVMERGLSTSA